MDKKLKSRLMKAVVVVLVFCFFHYLPYCLADKKTLTGITPEGRAFKVVAYNGIFGPIRGLYRYSKVPRYWGLHGDFVLDISISIDGNPVAVPMEAYIDLSDFRLVGVKEASGEVRVLFDGADAGESYEGFFQIKGLKVVRREIVPGEFPEFEPEVKQFDS